jgi:putative acetyltransferase
VTTAAFGSAAEADIVETLRADGRELISLVAEEDGEVVGHILFSPVRIADAPGLRARALAPMAVLPERQRRGIGSALVRAGLEECRRARVDVVFVVGHPAYYPRFGFAPASRSGFSCEFDVSDDVFMVAEVAHSALKGRSGIVCFHEAFGRA